MRKATMRTRSTLLAIISAACLSACGTDSGSNSQGTVSARASTDSPKSSTVISRDDFLEVTCGQQIQAHGSGAGANEIVTVRIQEQVPKGIDISSEVVADTNGNFIMNDFCDPQSPNAEVPALWTFKGATTGRTGRNMITYKLPATPPSTTGAPTQS